MLLKFRKGAFAALGDIKKTKFGLKTEKYIYIGSCGVTQKWKNWVSMLSPGSTLDAFRDLFLAAQSGVTFPTTTTDPLVVCKEQESGLLVCGGRVQSFKEDKVDVPLLPYSTWI